MMEQDIKQYVGRLIREARKVKGMTQRELSDTLGVSEAAVYGYENGQNFTIETLAKIAGALGVSVESLVRGL